MSATTTQTLTGFLLARIAEDEGVTLGSGIFATDGYRLDLSPDMGADHIVISRARVLAECEAKRRIVKEHSRRKYAPYCRTCDDQLAPCPTVRALALPYAEHPDFREEWRA